MTSWARFREGSHVEVTMVMIEQGFSPQVNCDKVFMTKAIWEKLTTMRYSEVSGLLDQFVRASQQAPENTTMIEFKFNSYTNYHWVCRATMSVEDGLRVLTFSEAPGQGGQHAEEGRTEAEVQH